MQSTILSDTELIEHFQQTGEDEIFNQILKCHEKLLKKLRHKFYNLLSLGVTLDELEQEILLSFFHAVMKFDQTRNCKFVTFCWRHVCNDLCDLYGKQRNLYKNIADNSILISDQDDGDTALDLISSIPDPIDVHDRYLENAYYNQIRDYLSSLDIVTQAICTDYLCNGLTQRQIAERLSISAIYVSRIIKNLTTELHQIILEN